MHELGHFIAAQNAGVKVDTFSIGMGPKLVRRTWGKTEYCLSAIPLGGYVKMKGENPDEAPTGAQDELMSKSIPARFSIFIAGPAMNIILAVILVSFVFFIGIKLPRYIDEPPVIGWVDEDSPAENAGLQIGDLILSVGGEQMNTWEQTLLFIASTGGRSLDLEIERGELVKTITVVPDTDNSFGAGEIGIGPVIKPIIGGFTPPGYPAEQAGLQIGDQIVAINDTQIMHWFQLVRIVSAHPNEELQITVLRDGKEIDFAITPKEQDGDGKLGIELQQQTVLKKYGIFESISLGIKRSWELTTLTIDLLKRLATRQASVKTVGGPIMIAQLSGQVVREGIAESLNFMGFVSLSLGIFNLLPIPILDGGHIFLLLVEILYRRPLRMREREIAQIIGLLILIPLMLFVFYNDIVRVLGL